MESLRTIFDVLARHGVPFVIVGGHAVSVHGHIRTTEDADIVFLRSADAERALLAALTEMHACWIADDIDPATGLERAVPVTAAYVRSTRLMMLVTEAGFLDVFDFVPGLPQADVGQFFRDSVESGGLRYASLEWLKAMKRSSDRPKDRADLENL